ncbi:MAG: (d)CMP kinase [Bacteroidales bacterium]
MTDRKIIVAVDGNSSCGKSTYAKRIAAELNYGYIDTGAMYRVVTLACMEAGLFDGGKEPPEARVVEELQRLRIGFRHNPEAGRSEIYLNERMVEDRIRELDVSDHVSYIATLSPVRRKLVDMQRALGEEKGIVMDGRDIGTVVFPRAELKIFLTASNAVRAMRRYKELQEKGMEADLEQVRANLEKRDRIDSSRADSPLVQAEDALLLDNSELTLDDQMVWFREQYKRIQRGATS